MNEENWTDGLRMPEDPYAYYFTYELGDGITVTRGDKIHVRGPHTHEIWDAVFVCHMEHNFVGQDVENTCFWIKWSALTSHHNNEYEMIHPGRLRKVFTKGGNTFEKLDRAWVDTTDTMTLRHTRVINYYEG